MYVNNIKKTYVLIIKGKMLENPLQILIKKQLCSTNLQPPFSQSKLFLQPYSSWHGRRPQSKINLKTFTFDADCHLSSF